MHSRDAASRLDPVHIELWCPHGPEIAWQVVAVHGREALSRPYAFELELWCEDAGTDIEAALGVDAELLFERSGLTRAVYGVITEVQIEVPPPGVPDHEGVGARVKIAPAYQLLEQQIDTRFFTGQSVIEILREHLGAALESLGRTLDVESRITGSYNSRDYCVQFRESTFDFCNRLMEEEGITYMFVPDPDSQREVMVLVDNNEAYGAAELLLAEPVMIVAHQADELDRESIQRLDWRSKRTPNRVVTRGHNYKQPATYDEGEAEQLDRPGAGVREQYIDGDRRQITDDPRNDPDAQQFTGTELDQRVAQARVLLQQQQRDAAIGHGRSNAIGFSAGSTFELADARRGTGRESQLLLTEVVHVAKREDGPHASAHVYTNTFACMPRSRPHRPKLRTPRPRVHGVQTGVVVGRDDHEIHTDTLGRVRVRLHADRQADDEHHVCWIRVAQMWAGPGYGSMVIPRVGMQVVVSFVDGNPDCPLVTGCVYDGVNTPPRPLPAELSRSTFKTNSTPGGDGYNELMFEDAKGREQIFMHAQGRMDLRVRGSLFETVGGSHEVVLGPLDDHQNHSDYNLFIGNEINVRSKARLYSKILVASYQQTGALYEVNTSRQSHVLTDSFFNAKRLIVETAEVASTKSNEIVLSASSALTLKAGEHLILESNNNIGLKVGESFISIGIDGIDIGGPRVRINSGGHVANKASDGLTFEEFEMIDPIKALAADDGRPGSPGGGGGRRRSHDSWPIEPHRAPPMVGPKKLPPAGPPSHRGNANDRQLLNAAWSVDETWCSETAFVEGEFDKSGAPWLGTIAIIDHTDGSQITQDYHDLGGGTTYCAPKAIYDILPRETGEGKEAQRELLAVVDSVRTLNILRLRFLSDLPSLRFTDGRARFDVWVVDHEVVIGGTIEFTRGWLLYVIHLFDSVPEDTGGAFDKSIHGMHGWRHCKVDRELGGKNNLAYWNGEAWMPVPMTWTNPLNTRLSGNAIWKEVDKGILKDRTIVKMQYGNDVHWTGIDDLGEWSSATSKNLASRLEQICCDVEQFWSNTFDIKRDDCLSNLAACCGYPLRCELAFREVEHKTSHSIILAENDTRANASAWPFDVSYQVAAHEFGHHLGNPDEYPGAGSVDPSVNGDGAAAGIDDKSIMGSGTIPRRRHLDAVCKALSQLVSREVGKHFTYIPMQKGQL